MSQKQRIRELNLGPSEKITSRNSVVGSHVIADYLDPANNTRVLVLKRPEYVAKTRVKKSKTNSQDQPQPARPGTTTFPAEVQGRG